MSTPGAVRQRFKPPSPNRPPKVTTTNQKPPPRTQPFSIEPLTAFYLLLLSHTLAALYHPIQDCDETFNYWEPTHYLTEGRGFQTWEYSPDYAIRSWGYAGLHALILLPFKLFGISKVVQFFALRISLGAVCAACEARLFAKLQACLHPRIAITFLFVLATSPGMAHASIAYLPSSFAMYFVSLGTASFLDWRGGLRTAHGIWMFGLASTLGWPFAALLVLPFLAEVGFMASFNDKEGVIDTAWSGVNGVTRSALGLLAQLCVDWFFYKKLVVVPANIVLYNVFGSSSSSATSDGAKGPNIYGTEPWDFYLKNLALNFHVFLPLALVSMPLLLVQHSTYLKGTTKASWLRGVVFLTPFYLWLAVFTLQPHKEERFMYPAYPLLALNAAWSCHILWANLGSVDAKDVVSRFPISLRRAGVVVAVATALGVSVLRTVGTVTAYGAPLSIYQPLHTTAPLTHGSGVNGETTVCLGKEWYRFPTHYLLPKGVEAKFLKSEFDGLLPGEFSTIPSAQGFGLFPGAWLVPAGMNDANEEDLAKYTEVNYCDYIVDSRLPSTRTTILEPDYVHDDEGWERVKCLPFLDATSTGMIGRMLWLPDSPLVPERFRRVWGEYCLLKKKEKKSESSARPTVEVKGARDGYVAGVEHIA
ncbi:mannosyltransferase [Elasticomyces elasticus]|uniref:Mannosyltransferase n=1 Tax=Elasticomyces elasticus TaxID=574655 RepID=A0AAN7VW79_9PEZI|nr:mannosyltransferase [Elasticomyces elasticus]